MAFQTKRILRNKIMRLEYRIEELEERLCPCESHDWKQVGSHLQYIAMGEVETIRHYKCRVCGKRKEGF